MQYDVIVIGIGAMGSATCRELARRGARVLGLEQYPLAHALGSSHGETRLIRQAYFEEARYVPLLKRVYPLWDELGDESGRRLFHRTGLLIVGPPGGGKTLSGARQAAERHGITVQVLDDKALRREYPDFRVPDGSTAVFEPGGGYLEVENAITALARSAERNGATLRFGEAVHDWRPDGTVITERATYRAGRIVITGGAWATRLLRDLDLPLRVWRVPQFWFGAPEKRIPCFAFDDADTFLYGFPRLPGAGLKIAEYHPADAETGDPSTVDRALRASDSARVVRAIREYLPWIDPRPRAWSICLYTMSPDTNFILDRHPRHGNVTFAAGFSGHGFKFAPVIGEILADLSQDGATKWDIGFLRYSSSRRSVAR